MDASEVKDYEIAFLTRDEGGSGEIAKSLERAGAEITFPGPVEKINLTYAIRKETSACFGYLHFRLAPECLTALDRDLLMNPVVLRFLIVSPPFVKAKPKMAPKAKARALPHQPIERNREPLPLSNEALERKIEEILQE